MRTFAVVVLVLLSAGCGKKGGQDYSVPGLVGQLKDKNPDMRYSAARALGRYGHEAGPAVPALVEALKDESPMVRMGAAYALGDIGPDAREAVAALQQASKDRDTKVRQAAAYALKRIEAPPRKK
jgi:HEAT repeat protein